MISADVVKAAVAQIAKRPPAAIREEQRLAEDLGLRSLVRVELAVLLEDKLGQPVSDATVMRARTVGDLVAALGGPPS